MFKCSWGYRKSILKKYVHQDTIIGTYNMKLHEKSNMYNCTRCINPFEYLLLFSISDIISLVMKIIIHSR